MIALWVRYWQDVPVCTEVFSNDRVVWFTHFTVLQMGEHNKQNFTRKMTKGRTMNLRSLENVNLKTAIMRSNASSESLTLSERG